MMVLASCPTEWQAAGFESCGLTNCLRQVPHCLYDREIGMKSKPCQPQFARGRWRRASAVAVAGTLVTGVAALNAPTASAYDGPENPAFSLCTGGGHRFTSWHFEGTEWGAPYSANLGNLARSAMSQWSAPEDYDGSQLAAFSENFSGAGLALVWTDNLPVGIYARTDCTTNQILFNRAYLPSLSNHTGFDWASTTNFMTGVTRHEAGHTMRLSHTGTLDSFDLKPPTMLTCLNPDQQAAGLSSDDYGQLGKEAGVLPLKSVQENVGFEQGISPWLVSGGTYKVNTTGGTGGPSWLGFKPNDWNADYVSQPMMISVPNPGGFSITADAKKYAASDTGNVEVDLGTQLVQYTGNINCLTANYQSGKDEATHTAIGQFITSKSVKFTPGTGGWSTSGVPSSWYPTATDAVAVSVEVHNHMKNSAGNITLVGIDNVRAVLTF